MSFEGVSYVYCKHGHLVTVGDAYELFDTTDLTCPHCGSKAVYEDIVDLTNGCYCDELQEDERPCPAHERFGEDTIVGYDLFPCGKCGGTGHYEEEVVTAVRMAPCQEQPCEPTCSVCWGTGFKFEPSATMNVRRVCQVCGGRGKVAVPVYPIPGLVRIVGGS